MTKLAVTGLAVGVLGVGIAAGMQWRDLRGEQAQGAQLRERVSALEEAQLAAAAAPPSTPSILPVVATPQPAAAAATPEAATSPPDAPATTAGTKAATSVAEAVLANPQAMEMARSMLRQLLPQQYPDIATEMNMSAAEVDKLFDTLARQQVDLGMSGSTAMFSGGELDASLQDMQLKMQQQQKAHDAELAAQLGSKYSQWQDYQGTAAARQQVERLQAVLDADNRLSEAGRKSVIAALAVEEARFSRQQRDDPMAGGRNMQEMLEKELQRTTEYNQRRIQVASPHLTVAQRDAYKRLLDQQTNMAGMLMRSMAAPAGAQP